MEKGIRHFLYIDQNGTRTIWDLDTLLYFFNKLPHVVEFLNIADVGDVADFWYRDQVCTVIRLKNNTIEKKKLYF